MNTIIEMAYELRNLTKSLHEVADYLEKDINE